MLHVVPPSECVELACDSHASQIAELVSKSSGELESLLGTAEGRELYDFVNRNEEIKRKIV